MNGPLGLFTLNEVYFYRSGYSELKDSTEPYGWYPDFSTVWFLFSIWNNTKTFSRR
jgi:hypothetical protein